MAVVADLRHMSANWDAPPWRVVVSAVVRSPMYPSWRAVIWVRSGMWCWRRGMRALAQLCKARAVRCGGVEVHPAAQIGPGWAIAHGAGLVIGHEVVAGANLVTYQGVTLGHGPHGGQPKIGDDVQIYAGAVVLGPITIGDRAKIGANSVVLADVPADTTVTGVWKGA